MAQRWVAYSGLLAGLGTAFFLIGSALFFDGFSAEAAPRSPQLAAFQVFIALVMPPVLFLLFFLSLNRWVFEEQSFLLPFIQGLLVAVLVLRMVSAGFLDYGLVHPDEIALQTLLNLSDSFTRLGDAIMGLVLIVLAWGLWVRLPWFLSLSALGIGLMYLGGSWVVSGETRTGDIVGPTTVILPTWIIAVSLWIMGVRYD